MSYQNRLWQSTSLVDCIGFLPGVREYAVEDSDGGIFLCSTKDKKDADVIAKALNEYKEMRNVEDKVS